MFECQLFYCYVGDAGAAGEKKNGKHFFTRKENSHPRDYESNHAAGDGFWRLAGTEVPIYNKPSGGADEKLVGMKRTLVFHFRKSSSTERTGWVMQEFRLAGASLVPCLVMRPATGDVSMPPCGCTKTTTTKVRRCIQTSLCHCIGYYIDSPSKKKGYDIDLFLYF